MAKRPHVILVGSWQELDDRDTGFRALPSEAKHWPAPSGDWQVLMIDFCERFILDFAKLDWFEAVHRRHWELTYKLHNPPTAQRLRGDLKRAYWKTIEVILQAHHVDLQRSGISETELTGG